MLTKKLNLSLILSVICYLNLILIPDVTASDTFAYGEVNSSGDVSIDSSTGKWVKMQRVYPLLKNTKLKTLEGVAFIQTKEGSRIDLSQNTELSMDSQLGKYEINLVSGTISFNITPAVSLNIITKDTNISVSHQIGGIYTLVAGPGATPVRNIQGIVSITEEGTYVRSIAGKIGIRPRGLQARILNSGDSFFSGEQGSMTSAASYATEQERILQGLIAGAFFTTGTTVLYDVFRTHDHEIGSPSGF